MSTNRSFVGLTRAPYRVQKVSGVPAKFAKGTVTSVDVDDHQVQLWLAGGKEAYIRTLTDAGTATISNGTPAVVTKNGHGFVANDIVVFTSTGALPAGLTIGTKYYVLSTSLSTNTFRVSATVGGAAINTSDAGSGTHTVTPASTRIVGLHRTGFRIRSYTASNTTKVVANVAKGVVPVDLTDPAVVRTLKRNFGRFIVSASATSVAIRGIVNEQNGFEIKEGSANTTSVLTSTNVNVTATDTVVIGTKTYTFKTTLTEVKATNTVNDTGGTPANGNTVVVNGRTYTFKTGPVTTNDDVLINGGAGSMTNLSRAINNSGGTPGTDYQIVTANADVTAGAVAGTTITLTAKTTVAATGNALTLTKVGGNIGVGGATFSGGVDPVANEVLVSVTNADGSLTNLSEAINAGANVGVDYSTGTAANADATCSAVGVPAAHQLTITPVQGGSQSIALSTTAATLSFAPAQVTDPVVKVYRLQTVTVNPAVPAVRDSLRRHFRDWIEV